jgi:hypothetical protein
VIIVEYLFGGFSAYNSLAAFTSDSFFVENNNISDVLTNKISHTMIVAFWIVIERYFTNRLGSHTF